MKKFLVIDTATLNCSISLLNLTKITRKELADKNQTKELIPLIKNLLVEENLLLKDLTAIAICIGPGTFTGTRVGAMTAKALSFGSNTPIIPFSTFDLFKEKTPYAIIDAGTNKCYLFKNDEYKLINHNDLIDFKETIYCINPKSFSPLFKTITPTIKSLDTLYNFLDKAPLLDHTAIELSYPILN